jgi:hypothetical protein
MNYMHASSYELINLFGFFVWYIYIYVCVCVCVCVCVSLWPLLLFFTKSISTKNKLLVDATEIVLLI